MWSAHQASLKRTANGHAQKEAWATTEWSYFKAILKTIKALEAFSLPSTADRVRRTAGPRFATSLAKERAHREPPGHGAAMIDRFTGTALLFASVARRTIRRRSPRTLAERLAAFPDKGWPVSVPVAVHWDDHHIPFIEAGSDDDLAVALGAIHAHLRLGQIEVARRLSQGRLAEMIGSIGVPVDRLIRTLDMARAVSDIERQLPDETRRWLDGFVRGINHYLTTVAELPEEFALFRLRREPWRVTDVLTLGRFISADVTWMVQFQLLRLRQRSDWPALWRRLTNHDISSSISPALAEAARFAPLAIALLAAVRAGSNSFAVAGSRTSGGAALLASDPHLPLLLPGPWLIAGFQSPSYQAVGLMIPGIPFIALGRNRCYAWGGTNLHAASSDLVAVPDTASTDIRHREVTIRVRWSQPRKHRVRESPWGPIVSDLPRLRSKGAIVALRWIGHQTSDEMTAMLRVSRGRNWQEFRTALDSFAVPGQTMLYADAEGHVGKVIAAHLPGRNPLAAPELLTTAGSGDGWSKIATEKGLPAAFDPPSGFVASANERPEKGDVVVGYHFSPPDRRRRLDTLLTGRAPLSVESAMAIQRDVHWATAVAQRDQILSWIDQLPPPRQQRDQRSFVEHLRGWDGGYAEDSAGALAFELLSYHLGRRLVPRRRQRLYRVGWGTRALIWDDIAQADPTMRQRALQQALGDAAKGMKGRATWGDRHRVRLAHPLAMLPGIGRAYRIADLPSPGGGETLLKTAHPLTARRHVSRFGSSARHISDLGDPDANFFAMMGGQDGWFGSDTCADQVALWRRGAYVHVPLRPETVAASFGHRVDLLP
jgi:penicillin G amidase